MFQRIIVPMDDSDLATKALDTALTLAEQFGSQIFPIYVRATPTGTDVNYLDDRDVELEEKSLRAAVADRLRAGHTLPAARLSPELRTGDPVLCILDAAKDHKADLIVMGTHGRHGLLDRVFGSTTERVLTQGSFAMLVVRETPE